MAHLGATSRSFGSGISATMLEFLVSLAVSAFVIVVLVTARRGHAPKLLAGADADAGKKQATKPLPTQSFPSVPYRTTSQPKQASD